MSSVAKFGKFCRLPKLAHFKDKKVAKIGKRCRLPNLANFGKRCWLPNLANFEDTKIAKIGKYHQLPKLANVVSCQIWQILKTPKLPKLAFEHTCYTNTAKTYVHVKSSSKPTF